MKIVITMAGRSSRFRDVGIIKPKHEIVVNGETLFEHSMKSLSNYFNETFLFITREGCYNADNIQLLCEKIGIGDYKIIEINEVTDGQAHTVLKAEEYIDSDEAIVVYNIDTAVEPFKLKKSNLINFEGFIPCFEAEGEHWSFIKPSDSENGVVVEVAEKKRISNLATIGFYYFRHFGVFKELLFKYQAEIKDTYKELYIAPIYQYLINMGGKVGFSVIDICSITNLGTPDEIRKCDEEFILHNK